MEKKRIEVSLGDQTLTAYEYDQVVLHTKISSGLQDRFVEDGELPTDTPAGTFHMQLKMPSKHMGDGKLTDDIHAYELPGVPWVSFFISTGFACHGTYWHDNFGRKMSHGCVNMPNPKAKWLYRWCTPVIDAGEWYQKGWGTVVKVFE
jgi:lipoprotein-anchoring transpeptidase ErfK/SrfK